LFRDRLNYLFALLSIEEKNLVLIKRTNWLQLLTNLLSDLHSIIDNPQHFLVLIFGRFILVRKLVNLLTSYKKISSFPQTSSIFSQIDTDRVVKSLQKNGYYLGLKLSPPVLQETLDFAYSAEIAIDGVPESSFIYAEKDEAEIKYQQNIISARYINPSSHCKAIEQLETDSKLLEIAAQYLGANPIHVRTDLIWGFPASSETYQKLGKFGIPVTFFHCDLDDYRALKFFFYFTDMDESSGPHICMRGSHNKRKLSHYIYRSHSDRAMTDYYGKENFIQICGEAGFGFAEDPFCFHRGTPPITKPRLLLQIEFALKDYGIWQ
jgi:hypothetical protein